LEVEEEEEKWGWRRKKEEAAPLRCGAGFVTRYNTADERKSDY
jgi:hypothetical protein